MRLAAYVEAGVGGHTDDAVHAWTFDLDHRGLCGQGGDEAGALRALAAPVHGAYRRFPPPPRRRLPPAGEPDVAERIGGEVWTTRKVLRRLAWHERGEVDVLRAHLARARLTLEG